MKDVKHLLVIICILLSSFSFGQHVKISGTVKDLQTYESLAYCNVFVRGTGKGTITNADGLFSITVNSENDILEFSYLGYINKTISASTLLKNENVFLNKNTYELQEVEIHADNDYLYKILSNSRKKVKSNYDQNISKSYYCVETKITPLEVVYPNSYYDSINNISFVNHNYKKEEQIEKTAEILECLYNASMSGARINDFLLRNGKAYLFSPEENYFLTFSSSQAMGRFCYFEENEIFPSCPFQYNKRTMKKIFNLELLGFDGKDYQIKFYPYDNSKKYFSGEVWIKKETSQVLKISLSIENAEICPLAPIHESLDTIKHFNMDVTFLFNPDNNYLPDHTFFDYDFIYVSRRDTVVADIVYKRTTSKIKSNGLIYFYDYNNPFILPYFNYDNKIFTNDYMLMSFIPHNEMLWNSDDIVQLTQSQKQQIGVMGNDKNAENALSIKDGKILLKSYSSDDISLFSFYYIFWSADKRVILSSPSIYDNISKDVDKMQFPSDLYNLKTQILLDVTEVDDSIVCKSWTILDSYETFYKYAETSNTRAFLNIFFDISEIERRKMQKQLDENKYSLSEIDAIYNSATSEMSKITKQFVVETDRGRDDKIMKKWNKYVFENLGIDNLKLVKNTEKSKN